MIQDILTYIIIFLAFSYTIFSFVKMLVPSKKNTHFKSSCSNCAGGCALKSEFSIKSFKSINM